MGYHQIKPQEPCPDTASGDWRSIDEVDLETADIGTLVQFRGAHPDSRYLMQIVEEEEKRFVDVWFKMRPGCFRFPVSSFKSPDFGLAVKIGSGYILPHFYYDDNGLQEPETSNLRAEGFRQIAILDK